MLENLKINIKFKLSALWTSLMSLYIYGDYFELYAPDKVQKLIDGNGILDSPTKLLLASIMLAIPSLMIFLSIFLKPIINKWLNIIFGIIFTLLVIAVASTALYKWYTFYVLYAILEAILTIMIVYYAWKWPRTTEQ